MRPAPAPPHSRYLSCPSPPPYFLIYVPAFSLTLFSFNDPATPEIYTLSLHDALPILPATLFQVFHTWPATMTSSRASMSDRKSTRLNSSHLGISYAVFCLKKKTDRRAQTQLLVVEDQPEVSVLRVSALQRSGRRLLRV